MRVPLLDLYMMRCTLSIIIPEWYESVFLLQAPGFPSAQQVNFCL
jgi:hypothetical protein